MKRIVFIKRLGISLFCMLIGSLLIRATSDRLLLELTPSVGAAHSVPLVAQKKYAQTLVVTRRSLSKLNYYMSIPAVAGKSLKVVVLRGSDVIGTAELPTEFVNPQGASEFVFQPTIKTFPGEKLQVVISVPDALSGLVKMQTRQVDDTFNPNDTIFDIDGAEQLSPLAYQAFYKYRPTFVIQLGALSILAGLFLLFFPMTTLQKNTWIIIYAVSACALFLLPRYILGGNPWLLWIASMTGFVGVFVLLKQQGLITPSALFGAQMFVFTTWFPLHFVSGRQFDVLVAAIPALFVLLKQYKQTSFFWRLVLITCVCAAIGSMVLFGHQKNFLPSVPVAANWRDVFLDPNQVAAAVKFSLPAGLTMPTWDHFGSYIGIPAAFFALIGMCVGWRKYWQLMLFGIFWGAVALLPVSVLFLRPYILFAPQHAIIGSTFALAFFAAYGFEHLYRFLGEHDKLVESMMIAVLVIVLFDLWNVSGAVLEFSLLT